MGAWIRDEAAEQRLLGTAYAYRVQRHKAEQQQGKDRARYEREAAATQRCAESLLAALLDLPLPPAGVAEQD